MCAAWAFHVFFVMPLRGLQAAATAADRGSPGAAPSPACCGVSAFAFMGTNAHVVMRCYNGWGAASASLGGFRGGDMEPISEFKLGSGSRTGSGSGSGSRSGAFAWRRSGHWVAPLLNVLLQQVAAVQRVPGGLGGIGGSCSVIIMHAHLSAPALAHVWDHRVGGRAIFPGRWAGCGEGGGRDAGGGGRGGGGEGAAVGLM